MWRNASQLSRLNWRCLVHPRELNYGVAPCRIAGAFSLRFRHDNAMCPKSLSSDTLNPYIHKVEYAVRGQILQLANQLQDDMNKGVEMPFKKIIKANIGDCHATGQKPISFIRQVLAACSYPEMMDKSGVFAEDVVARAKNILAHTRDSIGCYSDSEGSSLVRRQVADYIAARDGHPCDYQNIFLTNGASAAVKMVLYSIASNQPDNGASGVMVPIPQYPLYSASISEFGCFLIKYYLDESNRWALNVDELARAYDQDCENCRPRALVVINPGNPTGQVLSYENIKAIIQFAKHRRLLLLADEVYQENVYDPSTSFHSFKKVLCDMGPDYSDVELISFHSVSKGYYGECGLRGGYMELHGIDPAVKAQYAKLMSTNLGSNQPGQVVVSCVTCCPKPGDESYKQFAKERDSILGDLKKKAEIVEKHFNKIDGISCNPVQGALYAFPRLHLSQSCIEAAQEQSLQPDAFYCLNLLKETGICVVPGSGFGQQDGTYHFRVTILPPIEEVYDIVKAVADFNKKFRQRYP